MGEKEVVFKGRVVRCTGSNGDWKAYALDIDSKKFPEIKLTKYGNACISGNIHQLGDGIEYEVTAILEHTKYGNSYKVINLKRDKPNTALDMQIFLSEILTPQQAYTLFEAYPDIVNRVMSGKLDDIDLNKTKGIKEATFNKIKEKIVDNFCLVELVAEFQGLLSLPMLKKLYLKYQSVQMIRNKMKSDPYKCLCGLARVGFKTADGLLLEIDRVSKENLANSKKPIVDFEYDLKTSSQRCLSCVLFLLEENESKGHTKMDIVELKHQCDKLVPACANHFATVVKEDCIYYHKASRDIALNSTFTIEQYISENILKGLKIQNTWDYDFTKYKSSTQYVLSDEQLNALNYLCKHNISILNGCAGTGKSATTNAVIQMLKENKKSFRLFSPTGKAAKVLAEFTGEPASTIHRGLGYIPPNEWSYNQERKLDCDVLIIDEWSMADIFIAKRIIDAVDFSKTKLMLIGDNAQLPSVACGNLLHDFMCSDIIPTTTLTKVFRYSDGGLMMVATNVRECKSYLPDDIKSHITFLGDNKDYAFINSQSTQIVNETIALYKKLLSQGYKPNDIQVLSAFNKGECGSLLINNHIQKIANSNCGSDGIKVGDTTYYVGDLVIQKVNNYKAKIYIEDSWAEEMEAEAFIANGETGVVVEVGKFNMIIDFDSVKVNYSRDDLQGVGLGYSISIHKSQGSSIKIVILLTPQAHSYMLNSNLIYVGLTRMKEKCFHLGNIDTLNKAIKKKENLNRHTFMQELLKGAHCLHAHEG